MKYKLVRVEWIDAATESGWCDHDPDTAFEDMANPPLFGLLIEETDLYVCLSQTHDGICRWLNKVTIPRSTVLSITVIQEFEWPTPKSS